MVPVRDAVKEMLQDLLEWLDSDEIPEWVPKGIGDVIEMEGLTVGNMIEMLIEAYDVLTCQDVMPEELLDQNLPLWANVR